MIDTTFDTCKLLNRFIRMYSKCNYVAAPTEYTIN